MIDTTLVVSQARFSRAIVGGVFLLTLMMTGCTSPAEQADRYYQSGMDLLEKKNPVKASLEFQNALQIMDSMPKATYGLALVAEQQEEWRKMFGLLNEVVEAEPAHWEAHLKRGQLLLASHDPETALEVSETVLELAPKEPSVFAFRAAVLFKLGNVEEAEKAAAASLTLDPRNIEALVILANNSLASGQERDALAYIDQGLEHAPKNIGLSLFKIEVLEILEEVEQARKVHEELIVANPHVSELPPMLASFYMRNGMPQEGEATLRALSVKEPDNLEAKLNLVQFIAATHGTEAAAVELKTQIAQAPAQTDLQFALVELQRASNEPVEANALLRKMVSTLGDTSAGLKAKEQFAVSLYAAGDRSETRLFVDEILKADPRSQQGLFLRAAMAIEERKLDKAISDLRAVLLDAPESSRALLLLGVAHQLAGSPELAESQYQRAFVTSGDSPEYGLAFANYLTEQGLLERAEEILERASRVTPGNQQILERLAQVRLELGDGEGAEEAAKRLSPAGAGLAAADRIRGAIYALERDHEQSIAAYTKAYQASSQVAESLEGLTRAYLAAGKTEQAMALLESAAQTSSTSSVPLLLMGQLYLMQGDKQSAQERFEAAISSDVTSRAGYLSLSGLHLQEGKFFESGEVLAQGLAVLPGDITLMQAQAEIFERSGRVEEAIQMYEELLARQPNSDVVANNLASLLSEHSANVEGLNRAYKLAQRFQRSNVPHFKDTLGWASYRIGRYADAVTLLEDVVAQESDLPIFRYHLGMSYLAVENSASARRELKAALELAKRTPFPYKAEADAALLQVASAPAKD